MATLLFGYYRMPPEKRDAAALEAARQRSAELWSIIDNQLAHGDYLAGDALSLADICVGIWSHRWHAYPIERPNLPRLAAWHERIAKQPGFRAHVAGPIS